jgi:hypothetical protein
MLSRARGRAWSSDWYRGRALQASSSFNARNGLKRGIVVGEGTGRRGLGMPGGRPHGLAELAVAQRSRVSRAREKRIMVKWLIFLDSGSRKQVITGGRRRLGNDFRLRDKRGQYYKFMIRSDQEAARSGQAESFLSSDP